MVSLPVQSLLGKDIVTKSIGMVDDVRAPTTTTHAVIGTLTVVFSPHNDPDHPDDEASNQGKDSQNIPDDTICNETRRDY